MAHPDSLIRLKTTLNHVGQYSSYPVQTVLEYDFTDPYAVDMRLSTEANEEVWTIGRELLTEGLEEREGAGMGDIRIWRCSATCGGDHVFIALTGDDGMGSMLLQGSLEVFKRFLRRTYIMVPRGYEPQHIDIDNVIEQLLAEESM